MDSRGCGHSHRLRWGSQLVGLLSSFLSFFFLFFKFKKAVKKKEPSLVEQLIQKDEFLKINAIKKQTNKKTQYSKARDVWVFSYTSTVLRSGQGGSCLLPSTLEACILHL